MNAFTNYSNDKDRELWINFKDGDIQAFDKLYVQYAPLLYNYGIHLIPNQVFIKDCLHDFFVYLWQKRDNLGVAHSIKAYLFISFKRRLMEEKAKLRVDLPVPADYVLDPVGSYEDRLIARETENNRLLKIKAAFQHLTPRQKEALFLKFHENLTYSQIANVLNLKEPKYARTLIYRSINHLKSALSEKDLRPLSQVGNSLWWLALLLFLQ